MHSNDPITSPNAMTTINQLIKAKRPPKKRLKKSPALQQTCFKRGTCLKITIRTPRKPNSAKRKIAFVKLSNHRKIIAYIPGEGHTLQEHSTVLIRGGRVPDLPGVRYHMVRGKLDLHGVKNRKTSRSQYGVPKPKQ